jgi:hypothetical protein
LVAGGGTHAVDSKSHFEPLFLPAVGTDKASLEFRAIPVRARAAEVRPSLLCAARVDNMNIKPVALLEGGRLPSFALWGKSGQYEQGGGNEGENCDG